MISGTHHPCPAVIALAPCHQTDWVQNPLYHVSICAYYRTTLSTGTSFPIQSTPFSPLLFTVQTERLWPWREHRQKNVQEQDHSPMLHPSSGTGCKTSFTKQKTLLLFGGSWNHICFQRRNSLIPLHSSPPPTSSTPFWHPPPPSSLPSTTSMGFPAWSQTALYKWTILTLLVPLAPVSLISGLR